jgi:hypothetical protein
MLASASALASWPCNSGSPKILIDVSSKIAPGQGGNQPYSVLEVDHLQEHIAEFMEVRLEAASNQVSS